MHSSMSACRSACTHTHKRAGGGRERKRERENELGNLPTAQGQLGPLSACF
jgi:hypothetical protein